MGRKQNRPASSAAAAAHLSNTPTFTSFAAATAHALPTYSTAQPTPTATVTPWDESALQILKRLSKRDATTKQRALADLNDHFANLPHSHTDTDTGQTFVAAWGPAFCAALRHDAPAVRSAALSLMSLTVCTFRRLVQPIFPTVLAVWVAATGDLSPAVADVATKSLLDVLPTPTHCEKVATRYGINLREYVVNAVASLSPSNFRQVASAALAVLAWLLDAAKTSDAIASVIDDPANPLQLLAKGVNKSTTNAAPRVCAVVINTLSHMTPDNPAHMERAKRFADLSVLIIRIREPAGWDLILTLFRSGWYRVFGDSFGKLPAAVRDAVTTPLPTGLHALLPLFDALPPIVASSEFALSVLSAMRNSLGISDISSDSRASSVSYSVAALPAFLEVSSFIHTVAASRWLAADKNKLAELEDVAFTDYISPACCLFFCGSLPSTPKPRTGKLVNGGSSARKGAEGVSRKPVQEAAIHVARLLRVLTEARATRAFTSFADAFVNSIDKPNLSERLWRLECVLDNTRDLRSECQLSYFVVDKLVMTKNYSVESALRTLAFLLSSRGTSATEEDHIPPCQWQSLAKSVASFARVTVTKVCESQALKGNGDVMRDLGTVYSWVLWAAPSFEIEDPLLDIIDTMRQACTAEEHYQILNLVVRAHRARRDSDHVSSWNPIQGEEFDAIVMDALSTACSSDADANAAVLTATAVDPTGGSSLSEEALKKVANKVISYMKANIESDIVDEITTQLLASPLCLLSLDRNEIFRNLTASSILRAPHVSIMMTALLTQLRSSTKRDVLELAGMMIDVLRDSIFPLGNNEMATSYARGFAKILLLIGEESIEDSVLLCEKLLPSSSPSFTTEFLKHVPFRFVFGNGTDVPIRMDHLTVVLETAYPKRYAGFMEDVESFVQCIDVDERARVTANIADRYLTSGNVVHKHMLGAIITAMRNDAHNGADFRLVSQRLHGLLSHHMGTRQTERIPGVVRLCTVLTNGGCLNEFRDLVDDSVRIIRKDSFSSAAGTGVDIVTATLAYAGNEKERIPRPAWLKDSVSLCLRTVRRCFEQSHDGAERQLDVMEARGAGLTCSALRCLGYENVSDDDIRFWTLRSLDTMKAFVQTCSHEDKVSKEEFAKLAPITSLSLELIRMGEQKDPPHKISSMVDEINHWASWVSVLLLPMIQSDDDEKSAAESGISSVYVNVASELILRAAERGTLLTREGELPVKAERLYRLVPYLASGMALFRKAVLTVLTLGATIDLQDIVSRSFPDQGFGDENEEIIFATKMIPLELRTALHWQTAVENRTVQIERDVRCRELGYFLAWRLFLDLIRYDEETAMRRTVEAEDLSFRRAGITYLRANPAVFSKFFNKCIEVVVDGSSTEQAAAGTAASKALEVEEHAAQGIQLARQEVGSSERSSSLSIEKHFGEGKIEEAVGHAAGIVFARALQRLPALSRDHVMDRVDRGTSARIESFVRKKVAPLLIAAEIRKVKEWGAFGGGAVAQSSTGDTAEGELNARGSVAGREVWATYTFSDVTLEIGMRLPDTFPLQSVQVEARSRVGMSEARWRKTLLGMTTLLRAKDGTLAEAVELWRRNLDKTFQGAEECPICYSVLHLSTAALPKMQCRTCKNLFHSDCLCKWFTKSNSSACPLCRSAF